MPTGWLVLDGMPAILSRVRPDGVDTIDANFGGPGFPQAWRVYGWALHVAATRNARWETSRDALTDLVVYLGEAPE